MIARRELRSGALAVEVSDENDDLVWSAETVPSTGARPAYVRTSGPVASDLSPETLGHMLEAVWALLANLEYLNRRARRAPARTKPTPRSGDAN